MFSVLCFRMSDEDAPYKHTRSSDLKRAPMRGMASRGQPTIDRSPGSDKGSESHDSSVEQSPKGRVTTPDRSSSPKKKGLYPVLDKERKEIYPSLDIDSVDGSNKNQSAKKRVVSPQGKPRKHQTDQPGGTEIHRDAEPINDVEPQDSFNMLIRLGVIVLIIAACALLYPVSEKVVPGKLTTAEVFLENFKEIKSSYPAQNARFWKIIGSQVKRVLSNDSSYPAVILLGTPVGYSSLGTCLTRRVVHAVNDAVSMSGESYIDTASLDQTSPAKTKYSLDENLKSKFDNSKGAIIDHVEKLPAQAALLLHGYCDGDNAPYKDIVLFLVFHTDLTNDSLNDKVVERSLEELWGSELGVDEMPALCSRIANNIVVLSPEDNESLSTC